MPWALSFLVFFSLYNDTKKPYQNHHMFWQVCGFCFPIAGLLVFFASFFICTEPEPFDHDVDAAFNEDDHTGLGAESSMAAMLAGPNTGKVQDDAVKAELELAKVSPGAEIQEEQPVVQ